MKPFETVVDLLRYAEENYALPQAFNHRNQQGEWDALSSEAFAKEVRCLALGLRTVGLKKGDKVGILAPSCARWTVADCAIMMCGAVVVPLFENISSENLEIEILQAEVSIIFISGELQRMQFQTHSSHFRLAISLYGAALVEGGLTYEGLCAEGEALSLQEADLYEDMRDQIQPDDLATIVYTSGSTGKSKGVMLTHHNITGLTHLNPFGWGEKERYLNILPLAHIFARSINFLMIARGIPIYYIDKITTFGMFCRELHPTILVVVPRVLEKSYASICIKIRKQNFLRRTIARLALHLANQEGESFVKKWLKPLADKFIYSQLRDALGGDVHTVISGGSALNPQLCHFFHQIGIPVYEGWGQTEAATISCNTTQHYRLGSAGVPFEGMQVKCSQEGEILVKGPNVMQGYYKDEEATQKAFTEDGWLHSGDRGSIDREGYITIHGRLEEMYKTSTGEWIIPVPIEQELCKSPLVDAAFVIGANRSFATALIYPDFEELAHLKKQQRAEHLSDKDFLESPVVKRKMAQLLSTVNKKLDHWKEIRDYRFLVEAPTIANQELTPSMKIRRDFICHKYRHLIDSMYVKQTKETI